MRNLLSSLVLVFVLNFFMFGVVSADYNDVSEDSIYYQAISDLDAHGVLQKHDDFRPSDLMTRAAFYKIIFNYVGYKPGNGEFHTRYLDVDAKAWFAPYVQKAHDLHVLQFNPDDSYFYPANPITRVEAMQAALSLFGIPHSKVVKAGDLSCSGLSITDPRAYLFVAAERYELFDDLSDGICGPAVRLSRGDAALLVYRLGNLRTDGVVTVGASDFEDNSISKKRIEEGGDSKIILNLGNDVQFADDAEKFFDNDKFRILLNVWGKIHNEYVFQDKIDDEKLMYGAITGMVDGLDDPYSEFQIPALAKRFDESLSGTFQGIGASVDMIDGKFTIVSPLKGSPAEKAGLLPNDVVLKVDGKDISKVSLEEAVDMIRGPQGSTVVLTVQRNDEIFEVNVVRDMITLEHIEGQLKDSGVAYLRISSFANDTAERFVEEMETVKKAKSTGLIIDLRNNPGGYLDSTISILEHFVPSGQLIAKTQSADGSWTEFVSKGLAEYGDMSVVVLVNEGSASASEILAGTLQDYGIARLVGTTTFGKGTVQQVLGYVDGSQLKMSIANWFTAKGRNINSIGLEPDVYVEMKSGVENDEDDIQLQRAISELKR